VSCVCCIRVLLERVRLARENLLMAKRRVSNLHSSFPIPAVVYGYAPRDATASLVSSLSANDPKTHLPHAFEVCRPVMWRSPVFPACLKSLVGITDYWAFCPVGVADAEVGLACIDAWLSVGSREFIQHIFTTSTGSRSLFLALNQCSQWVGRSIFSAIPCLD
jgi:hypothetical protein